MINDVEIWKDIPRYKGLYQASNKGRIRRLRRPIINNGTATTKKGAIIGQSYTSKGYKRVHIHFNGKRKEELVHRLVAEAFIPNPKNFYCINHKDETRTNNAVENLEWCDYKYNNTYGTRIKRSVEKQSVKVLQYTSDGRLVAEYPSINEAGRKTGINAGHICHVCKGIRPNAGGYVWRYKYLVAYEIFRAIQQTEDEETTIQTNP